ncbi:hypothetical protein BW687_001590 [Pseudomonas graminis]|uniref:hypothetical protein n=1 Tax=Pseudomonas graminis TaxID=158627 RepID=UPI00234ABE8B|nr:hypothetical protein [Pseudomonas graminis]MDC6378872.1 hypothetical protein [Pseudomonas graminis]
MRQALFGNAEVAPPLVEPAIKETVPDSVIVPPAKPAARKKVAKAFTPRLRVHLRVGNEYEGETFEMTHEADTLSTLLAEQEAVKLARNKFRYVEVVSVKSM